MHSDSPPPFPDLIGTHLIGEHDDDVFSISAENRCVPIITSITRKILEEKRRKLAAVADTLHTRGRNWTQFVEFDLRYFRRAFSETQLLM